MYCDIVEMRFFRVLRNLDVYCDIHEMRFVREFDSTNDLQKLVLPCKC